MCPKQPKIQIMIKRDFSSNKELNIEAPHSEDLITHESNGTEETRARIVMFPCGPWTGSLLKLCHLVIL